MNKYYTNIILKIIISICIIILICIEYDYINSLHGLYALMCILGFIWLGEQIYKQLKR